MPCWSPVTLKFEKPTIINGMACSRHVSVPCGKCLPCLQRIRSDWTQRIEYEERKCKRSAFITLTYDEFNVPVTDNGNLTLVKSDLQKYFKRVNSPGMKYFAVGEYGSITERPHYHAIVFNADKEKMVKKWSRYNDPFGQVQLGEVNTASVHYITKYLVNPENNIDWLDRQKPFRIMSKGIGRGYAEQVGKYCNDHQSNIVPVIGGNKCVIPRYTAEKIFSKDVRFKIAEKAIQKKIEEPLIDFDVFERHRKMAIYISNKTSKSKKC